MSRSVSNRILDAILPNSDPKFASDFEKIIESRFRKRNLPLSGESAAISLEIPKTAALAYDRTWTVPVVKGPPDDIGFYGGTDLEVATAAAGLALEKFGVGVAAQLMPVLFELTPGGLVPGEVPSDWTVRGVADIFRDRFKIFPSIVVPGKDSMNHYIEGGPHSALLVALTDIAAVSEEDLEWSQVAEFRKDRDCLLAYRDMLAWFKADMTRVNRDEMVEAIETRLMKYERALEKHGMVHRRAVLSKLLALNVATLGVSASSIAPWWFAAIGASISIAGITVSASKESISQKYKLLEEYSDIAYIHEAKKRLAN